MDSNWEVENPTEKQERIIKTIRLFLSVILAIVGITVLVSQLFPLATSYISGKINEALPTLIKSPLPQEYKDAVQKDFGYDPGKSYFQNLLAQSGLSSQSSETYDPVSKSMRDVVIDQNYSKNMSLTISKAGIINVNITPNVNSYDDKVYNQSLKHGLAHFKGTPLPGDGGNSFIYGHSAVQSFFNVNPNNPEVAFSKLEKAQIEDTVEIEKDGKTLYYVIRKIKHVDPGDFTVIMTVSEKETITLMTCWPLGIGTKRLVVIAERSE